MVAINTTPVRQGETNSTVYAGVATTTSTEYTFPSVQSTLFITNKGFQRITVTISGVKSYVKPNQSVRYTADTDRFTIKSDYGTHSFQVEGRSNIGDASGVDLNSITSQLASTSKKIKGIVSLSEFDDLIPNKAMIPDPVNWDWTIPLRNAISYCQTNGINKLNASPGVYRITNDIDLSTVPVLEIEGMANGHVYNGMGAKTTFKFENCNIGFNCGMNPYVTIKNIGLDGTNTTNTVLNFGFFTKLINVSVTGGLVSGGKISAGQNGMYANCSFSKNKVGLILEDEITTTQTFINCYFRENTLEGIKGVTSDCYFLRCTTESNGGKGVHLTSGKKLIHFEYCYFEANEMPSGYQMQLENTYASFNGCDFGSTQIVRVANIINSNIEFKNCKHVGDISSLAFSMDGLSKVIVNNSFVEFPIDNKAIIPSIYNEMDGSVNWNLSDGFSTIPVNFGKTLPLANYKVFITTSSTEEMNCSISGRSTTGFTINIFKKPTSSNATIFWRVKY